MARFRVQRSRLIWQTDQQSPLGAISLAGYIRNSRGISLTQLRNYHSFAVVYLLEGSGWMKVHSQPVLRCHAGDLLFVYPGVLHGYGPGPGESWNELYIIFDGPVFELWRKEGLLDISHAKQRLAPVSRWLPRLQEIVRPVESVSSEEMLRRVCLLQKFLSEIRNPEKPHSEKTLPRWLHTAMHELVEHPEITVEAIGQKLGLSYETFRKEFTRQVGNPPARYRNVRLIERAKTLIRERHLGNKELAETLGFYDEFHFSRRFREVTGESPREFRRQASIFPVVKQEKVR